MPEISEITKALRLLVVDAQDPFLKVIPNADDLVDRIDFAIQAAKLFQIKIALTEQLPEKLGKTTSVISKHVETDFVFEKSSFSALGAEGLLSFLKKTGSKHLLIAGLETPICIYQTVLDAMAQDFEVTVLSDCVGCRRQQDADEIFATLRASGCHILPSEAIFYSILGDSKHSCFKEYSQLIKQYG